MSFFSFFRFSKAYPDYIQKYLSRDFKYDANMPVKDLVFAVIDAETTGLKKSDQLITLGGVIVHQDAIDLAHILDQKYIHKEATEASEIHGELPENQSVDLDEYFKQLLEFLSNKIIVGHHISFDISKINQAISAKYPGFVLNNKILDTFQMMVRLNREKYERQVGGRSALNLDEICKEFGIAVENRHTALGDAFMTAQVLMFLLTRLEARGVKHAADLLL